jgi:hypothetical protein
MLQSPDACCRYEQQFAQIALDFAPDVIESTPNMLQDVLGEYVGIRGRQAGKMMTQHHQAVEAVSQRLRMNHMCVFISPIPLFSASESALVEFERNCAADSSRIRPF